MRGWHTWMSLPQRVGDRLGTALLGAAPGQVAISDSTTVNLFKLAAAALDARPERRVVVTDRNNFPTDRYVLEGLAQARDLTMRWVEDTPAGGPSLEAVTAALDDDVALLCLSHVSFQSAAIADLPGITAAAHRVGALVLWDLCHSVGSVPIDLDRADVDLAVGCTYKYLNAGPGAPAFLYVSHRLQDALRQPIWGWFGQRDQFALGATYEPADGITRFLTGTPSILGVVAVDEGVGMFERAGIEAVRAKGVALTELAVSLFDEWLAPLGFGLASPRDSARRGAHVAVSRADAWQVCQAMIAEGVVPDFRAPDAVRLGFAPLSTRFVDVWDGVDRMRSIVTEGRHLAFDATPTGVT